MTREHDKLQREVAAVAGLELAAVSTATNPSGPGTFTRARTRLGK